MKLMVVDDSSVMRRAIQRYASSLDLEVVGTAKDGEQALALFRQQSPDVVTLDITMPKMDGLATLKAILAERPTTRVLVVTALSDSATGIQALRLGAKGFLNKPFTEAELTEELTHVMES
ncbi:MAG: response regulator [Spirochaetales bacterium]